MRTCPSADGRWRALTCHRQVIHHAPFKSFSIVKTKNKVSTRIPYFLVRVKGLDSRGGATPAWSPAVETVHRTVSLYRLCSSPLDYKTKKTGYPIGYPAFLVRVKGLDLRGGATPAWSPAVETVHRTVSLYRLCSSPLDYKTKKTGYPIGYPAFLVRVKGLEPSRSCPHKNLNLTRLPIPPHPHRIITHCCEIIFVSRQSSFFFTRQSVA